MKWVLWLGTMSGLCNSCISKQAVDELGPEWIRSFFLFLLLFCSYLLNHYGTGLIELIFCRYIHRHGLRTPKYNQIFWSKIGNRPQIKLGLLSAAECEKQNINCSTHQKKEYMRKGRNLQLIFCCLIGYQKEGVSTYVAGQKKYPLLDKKKE